MTEILNPQLSQGGSAPGQVAQPFQGRVSADAQRIELTLSDYWRIILKRRMLILVSFITVLVASIFYTNSKIPIYQAGSQIRIATGPRAFQQEGGMFFPSQSNLQVYANMITSDEVMQRVVIRLGLLAPNATAQDLAEKASEIRGTVSTATDDVTSTIEIGVTYTNPELAAAIANQVAAVFVEVDLHEKTKQARKLRSFIEEQLSLFTQKLKSTEDKMRVFRQTGRALGIAAGLEMRLSELEKEKSILLKQFTEKHPDVIKVNTIIDSLKERIKKLPADELELARLQRELEMNDRAYREMKSRYESARLAEVEKVSDVSVVETASVPTVPISPQKNANKMAGALIGIVLGLVLAFVGENLDTSIGTIEDVEKIVRLPVIGIIPFFEKDHDDPHPWWRFDKNLPRFLSFKQDRSPDGSFLIMNQDAQSSLSESYRILRTFVEFMVGRKDAEGKILVLTSTGPQEGKTLTTSNLAIALAQSGKRTLLIDGDLRRPMLHRIFGLNRGPGLSDVLMGTVPFEEARKTMGDILVGDTSQWDQVLTTKMLDRLEIMSSGTHTTTPAELLESDEMKKLLERAKQEYAYILIDTPPVLPVTDARTLGAISDTVFFVYRSGKTARRALIRAKDELALAGVKVKGIILNQATPETTLTDAYYYQYYGEKKDKKKSSSMPTKAKTDDQS